MRKNKNAGFTLIELILVIAIMSILAALIIPRFTNLQTQAIDKQEDAIIGSLKEAINHQHMENVLTGKDIWPGDPGNPFPGNTPFNLLNPPIPAVWHDNGPGNGVSWRYVNWIGFSWLYWSIYCPHQNGDSLGAGATRGRRYLYSWAADAEIQAIHPDLYNLGLRQGQIVLVEDRGH